MSLYIATGSNLGDKKQNLTKAKNYLSQYFTLIDQSHIFHSKAVDYEDQDDFFNQVLEFETPKMSPDEVMILLFKIEQDFGRMRLIPNGPRIIDLDILFFDDLNIQTNLVNIPHPRLFERSFVVLPLSELKSFERLKNKYSFNLTFSHSAKPILD